MLKVQLAGAVRGIVPVAVAHVGCVIVPTVGAAGVGGWAFTTALVPRGRNTTGSIFAQTVYVPGQRC